MTLRYFLVGLLALVLSPVWLLIVPAVMLGVVLVDVGKDICEWYD